MKLSSSLVLIVMMVFLFFISCNQAPPHEIYTSSTGYQYSLKTEYVVVEADSCEYILFTYGANSWGGHRARCKYCLQRNKRLCE